MSHAKCKYRLLLLLVPAVGAIGQGCSREPHAVSASPEAVSDVIISVAQKTMLPNWVEATGTVRAAQTVQLASQSTGNLVEVRVREGDRVERDEVLAVIDDAQPRAALDQALAAEAATQKEISAAESDLALAESTLKRYQELYDKKSVSPQEFDEVKARQQSAQARREAAAAASAQAAAGVAQARKALENTLIRAPFAGMVTEKKVDAGTLALPGMVVLTLEDTNNYRLEADVDENDIRSVRVGESVPVVIDALASKGLAGTVAEVVPEADSASRSFLVKVDLPAAGLRSGLFGRARFPQGERSAILVPRTAIVDRGQLQGVYVVSANEFADLRYVTLGPITNEQIEVLSGLEVGEKLIAAPDGREYGGRKVIVRP